MQNTRSIDSLIKFYFFRLFIFLPIIFNSCGEVVPINNVSQSKPSVVIEEITLDKIAISLIIGTNNDSCLLRAQLYPITDDNEIVIWSSSDDKIVIAVAENVNDATDDCSSIAKVIAVAEGVATVTAVASHDIFQ